VPSAGGIDTALDRAEALGCDSIQIFSQSPRMWRPTAHPAENLERFRVRREQLDLPTLIHAPYLVNLAATDPEIVEKSSASLDAACEVARAIGAVGVVLHVGSHLGSGFEQGLRRAAPPLREALGRLGDGDAWLLLENTAGAGGTMGLTVDELARIAERVDDERLGVCLDSCHLYASGVDVGQAAALDALFAELDARLGSGRLRALHVNDSQTPLGSNRDRHANVGEGLIGEGLAAFLGHPRLQGLPAVLETPGHDGKGPDARCLAETRRLWRKGRRRYARAAAR
jgi:deoxyribonuclease-4